MAREQPAVAGDFLGLGMGDILSGDVVTGKQNLSPGMHMDRRSVPPLLNTMAMAGIENSVWSKAATLKHFLPLRGSPDDRFKVQIAENLPEGSFPLIFPLQIQDLASNNQKNGLQTQGDSLIDSSSQVREENGSSIPISGGFQGSSSRTMISPFRPEAKAVNGSPAASEVRLPSSGMTDMEHDPPLTIFYAGSVKVFNNISAKQAESIMILANAGNVQGNPVHPLAAHGAVKIINSKATPCPYDKSLMTLRAAVNPQTNAHQVNQFATNMQLDFENLTVPASSPVPTSQPMVPTALPHARKASLSRFLEKRRERAHSICPYAVKHQDSSLPEERLSSSNDPTCYIHTPNSDCIDKKQQLIPFWMKRVAEC